MLPLNTPNSPDPKSKLSKAESARINGAKSTGPKSETGKHNSSNANLKHGAYSRRILMQGENQQGYDFFRSSFNEYFLPTDPFEAECVDAMVSARWRIRRLESMETAALDHALINTQPAIEARFEAIDTIHQRGVAVQSELPTLESSSKVQERLQRIYDRNYKLLAAHRRVKGLAIPPQDISSTTSPTPSPDPENLPSETADEPNSAPEPHREITNIITTTVLSLVLFTLSLLSPRSTPTRVVPQNPAFIASHSRTGTSPSMRDIK